MSKTIRKFRVIKPLDGHEQVGDVYQIQKNEILYEISPPKPGLNILKTLTNLLSFPDNYRAMSVVATGEQVEKKIPLDDQTGNY